MVVELEGSIQLATKTTIKYDPMPVLSTSLLITNFYQLHLNAIPLPHLDHPSGHFPRDFRTKILYGFLAA
jgi:hypothetical protein